MMLKGKGIFHELIIEQYERSSKKKFDVVGTKRTVYNNLLIEANESLENNNYVIAQEIYDQILKLINDDPYPDEYNLSVDTLFAIKCCYCYSLILGFQTTETLSKSVKNSIEHHLIKLIEEYPNKIMPYYLKLLFHSRKPNELSTVLLCILLQSKHIQNDTVSFGDSLFEKLLPSIEEIMVFQKQIITNSLLMWKSSDIKDILKHCRISKIKNMAVQTHKIKNVNRYLQTDSVITKNVEVQVNLEVQEYKKKLLDAERRYRDAIITDDRRLREIQTQLDAKRREIQSLKEQLETQNQSYKNEIKQLKENITLCQTEKVTISRHNEKLQKFLLDMIEEKFKLRKHLHDSFKDKANFMIVYLQEILPLVGSNSNPCDMSVQNEIEHLNTQLVTNNRNMEILHTTYKSDKAKMIQSSFSESSLSNVFKNWPEVPQIDLGCNSVVFKNFKRALINIAEQDTHLQEMRNYYKGFLNYALTQFDSQPWPAQKRKFQSSMADIPSELNMSASMPLTAIPNFTPRNTNFAEMPMNVSSVTPSRTWINFTTTVHNHPGMPPEFLPGMPFNNLLNPPLSYGFHPSNKLLMLPNTQHYSNHSTVTSAHPGPLSSPIVTSMPNNHAGILNKKKRRVLRPSSSNDEMGNYPPDFPNNLQVSLQSTIGSESAPHEAFDNTIMLNQPVLFSSGPKHPPNYNMNIMSRQFGNNQGMPSNFQNITIGMPGPVQTTPAFATDEHCQKFPLPVMTRQPQKNTGSFGNVIAPGTTPTNQNFAAASTAPGPSKNYANKEISEESEITPCIRAIGQNQNVVTNTPRQNHTLTAGDTSKHSQNSSVNVAPQRSSNFATVCSPSRSPAAVTTSGQSQDDNVYAKSRHCENASPTKKSKRNASKPGLQNVSFLCKSPQNAAVCTSKQHRIDPAVDASGQSKNNLALKQLLNSSVDVATRTDKHQESQMPFSIVKVKEEILSDDEEPATAVTHVSVIEEDRILFHYISENCPGNTEERITMALLKVMDEVGGSFDGISKEQILEHTKVILRDSRFYDDISEQCCTICFEEYSMGPLQTLACKHVYHRKCIKMWLKNNGCCPICRQPSTLS